MSEEPQESAQNDTEEQQKRELVQKYEYIREWISNAPDFVSMMQVLVIKIMADRKAEGMLEDEIPGDEIQRIGQWLERVFDDVSAITGILDGHITVTFPEGHNTPLPRMTAQGEKWLQEMQQKIEAGKGAE